MNWTEVLVTLITTTGAVVSAIYARKSRRHANRAEGAALIRLDDYREKTERKP